MCIFASEPMPSSEAFRAVPWQHLSPLLLTLLLTACDGGFSNLPNIRTDRTDASLINYLPISLKVKSTSRSTNSEDSISLSKLRNNSLNRLSKTTDDVSHNGEEAHTLTHAFITENAKVLKDRANRVLRARSTLATMQTALEEQCDQIPTGEYCKLAEAAPYTEDLVTALGYLPSNEDWQPYEQTVVFGSGNDEPRDFKITLTSKSEIDVTTVSVRWNQNLSVLEESIHTRWITSTNVSEYNHTFIYNEDQTSSFNASGSINDSSYSISQDLKRTNSDLNEVTLSTLATWNTQTEQGTLKIDITADNDRIQSLSLFDNKADGARYESIAENTFDRDGKLTNHRYCIGSADSGCSMKNGWIQSVQTPKQ